MANKSKAAHAQQSRTKQRRADHNGDAREVSLPAEETARELLKAVDAGPSEAEPYDDFDMGPQQLSPTAKAIQAQQNNRVTSEPVVSTGFKVLRRPDSGGSDTVTKGFAMAPARPKSMNFSGKKPSRHSPVTTAAEDAPQLRGNQDARSRHSQDQSR